MKKFWKIPAFVILCSILLFAPMGTAFASDKNPPKDSSDGFVTRSASTSYDFPESSTEQPGGGITPDSSTYPMPGSGGTAIAEIGLMYNNLAAKGYGTSSISGDALGTFTLCAGVNWLKKDGNQAGSAGYACDYYQPGGSSKQVVTGLSWGSPYGHTWTESTSHRIRSEVFGGDWQPTLTFGVTL